MSISSISSILESLNDILININGNIYALQKNQNDLIKRKQISRKPMRIVIAICDITIEFNLNL